MPEMRRAIRLWTLMAAPAAYRPGIDRRAGARDGLERELVAVDLHQHEALILIECLRGHGGASGVSLSQLSPCSLDEVVDPLLRCKTFVNVVVARKGDVDAVRH